ncbi:hypothetical protein HF1_03990 [Mycoplasma haemofelis str. Langford 1]|uniref:Uncharacterized protein n=1 Tax=Mycoplasma haemofelis (strain Langford 1) TaxID=941640 RepID=E8ZGY6_MYCHL|nr:hypothetical protein [Mycoplasma haemofelis]CBY92407.1 hypothetical protein HF1_03990 [Mycoplasma haemofelis str. Langford 1]
MSKLIPASLGALGAGGLGVGGLMVLKPWQSESVVTFKDKYSQALLDDKVDATIWTKKYEELKKTTPNHPKLVEAFEKTKAPADEARAKELLKEGCLAIYSLPVENSKHFSDFKSFCSKTNADVSENKDWISEAVSNNKNKWDTALTSLKSHDKGELDRELAKLKAGIQNNSETFPEDKKTLLKGWCDSAKSSIFEGRDSVVFKNQESFCKVPTA